MMVFMVDVDFSKGLVLFRLVKSEKSISYFTLQRNEGYKNLQKFPFKIKKITTIQADPNEWHNIGDFHLWLERTFSSYDDGLYYLLAFRSSLRWVKRGHKKYQKVRPFEPFCKFLIKSSSVEMPDDFRKSARTGKTYRIFLLLKQEDEREEMLRQLKPHRRIFRR